MEKKWTLLSGPSSTFKCSCGLWLQVIQQIWNVELFGYNMPSDCTPNLQMIH